MADGGTEAWVARLDAWLAPFLAALPRAEQRRWAPLYVRGLLLPGERKSVEPMAGRVCPGQVQGGCTTSSPPRPGRMTAWNGCWPSRPTSWWAGRMPCWSWTARRWSSRGGHSAGVQRQCCGQLGRRANCRALVSLTLARGEVPVPVGLRLFLPDAWIEDADRRRAAGVPDDVTACPK